MVDKSVALDYYIIKNAKKDNPKFEGAGYIKYFGEDCVECFITGMLEIKTYKKKLFKNHRNLYLDTIISCFANKCWLCGKEFRNAHQ